MDKMGTIKNVNNEILTRENYNKKFNSLFSQSANISMTILETLLEEIRLYFFQYISQGHALFINNLLQSLFFMMAIIKIISWVLNKLNIFFAKDFNRSNIFIKILIFFLFFYIKIWNAYSAHLEILGYFCSVCICIHLYEGCIRLGTYFSQRFSKNGFGNISSFASILLIYLSYKIFRLSQVQETQRKYNYVALYFLMFGFLILITMLRRKQFIYILLIMTMMASIIMLREGSILLLKDTFLCKVNLPLEGLFYLVFAVQENYKSKEQEVKTKRLKGETEQDPKRVKASELFVAQVYFYLFFLINKRMYNLQIVFAAVFVLNYLGMGKLS